MGKQNSRKTINSRIRQLKTLLCENKRGYERFKSLHQQEFESYKLKSDSINQYNENLILSLYYIKSTWIFKIYWYFKNLHF